MAGKKTPLSNAILITARGLWIFILFMVFLILFNKFFDYIGLYSLLNSFRINTTFDREAIILIITLISTLSMVSYIYYVGKEEREKTDYQKQISLLESLYSELDAISSKEKKINLLDKEISTKGNLQWYKELYKGDLKPAHGIWNLNTKIYVGKLNWKIKNKETKPLKDALIHISQKIELIENQLSQYHQIPKTVSEKIRNTFKKAIMNNLKELIEFVETTKEFIEKAWRLENKG